MCKVAIIIPTMNRVDFLIRQLWYYSSVSCIHPIYIGDASGENNHQQIEDALGKMVFKPEVYYYHFPATNERQTIVKLAELAKEDYCAFTGDDDYLIPDSVSKCADFLGTHGSYRTAQGKAVLFTLNESGPYGILKGSHVYWDKKEIESETAAERVRFFSKNYWVPQFSVHRRKEFLADSVDYYNVIDKSFGEISHCFTFVCNGKSKFIDCLYLVRQGHDARYTLPGIIDWITGETWHSSYKGFIESLGRFISKCDGVTIEEGQRIIKQAFNDGYLKTVLRKKIVYEPVHKQQGFFNRQVVSFFQKNPSLKRKVKRWRGRLIGSAAFDFDALLQRDSPYYEDAKQVYDNFTREIQ